MQPALAGSVRLLGVDPWRRRRSIIASVGVVPEESWSPSEMTAEQLVAFCTRVRGQGDVAAALGGLRQLGIPSRTPFRELSRGQKKQVELALALCHRPRLLVVPVGPHDLSANGHSIPIAPASSLRFSPIRFSVTGVASTHHSRRQHSSAAPPTEKRFGSWRDDTCFGNL